MLVGWAVLSPLAKHSGWAPGPVGDMTTGSRGWILWISLAIMCTDSLVSLCPVIYETVTEKILPAAVFGTHSNTDGGVKQDKEIETDDRLVPISWVLWGTGISVVSGTGLVWLVFGAKGIKPWATVIGYLIGALLSILG